MIKNNETQKSLTDPDSKLMKDNGKFTVGFNNQVCVDANSHIISNYQLNNNPSDLGSITSVSSETKELYGFDKITDITDKGYIDRSDMVNALSNGIIPEVTPLDGKTGFNLEVDYEENVITNDMIKSTNKDDISKCLKAGVVPDIYKDNIESIEVKDVTVYDYEFNEENEKLSEDDLRDIAINEKCFARDSISGKVFCPMGEILRKKSNVNGGARYANKLACKNCKNPCTSASFKVVEFMDNKSFVKRKNINKRKKFVKKISKKVLIKTKANFALLKLRMQTSEHPHASMKFWDKFNSLLLKGINKATGEVGLYYCAYNIRRATNILGVEVLVNYFKYGIKPNAEIYTNNNSVFLKFVDNYHNFIKKSSKKFENFFYLYFIVRQSPPCQVNIVHAKSLWH